MQARQWSKHLVYLALIKGVLILSGCGDQSANEHSADGEGSVNVRFSIPWANRTGRELASAEVRFYGLNGDAGSRVREVDVADATITLTDDLGNVGWSYHFEKVGQRDAGVIQISAVASLAETQTGDQQDDAQQYLGRFEPTPIENADAETVDIEKLVATVCQTEPDKTLQKLNEFYVGPSASGQTEKLANQRHGDVHLVVALARECNIPSRLVVGLDKASGTYSGNDVKKWPEVFADGRWQMLDAGEASSEAASLRMRIVPDALLAIDRSPFFYICEAVGVNVDPGAMRIAISK